MPAAVAAFEPQIIVSQQGCDSHLDDPLAHLALSVDGQRRSYQHIHELAHTHANGRWIAVGGGGYEWLEVVPRAWTHLAAIAFGAPIAPDTDLPVGFTDFVMRALGPEHHSDRQTAE